MTDRITFFQCILALALLSSGGVQAQQPPRAQQEETYFLLTQGREVYGKIQKQDEQGVHLLIPGGSYLIIPDSQIVSREQRTARYQRFRAYTNWRKQSLHYPKRGLYGAIEVGLSFLNGTEINRNAPNFGSFFHGGYAWRPYLMTGVMMGIEGVPMGTVVPLAIEVCGTLEEAPISPMYRVQAGWAFGVNEDWQWMQTQGGPMASAGLGWRVHTRSKVQAGFLLNFRYQRIQQGERIFNQGPNPVLVMGDPLHLLGLSLSGTIYIQ